MRRVDLDVDPMKQFEKWYEEAINGGDTLPQAMALATASRKGIPSVRMVLFKGIREGGFEFFTNLKSRKGQEMEANPYAAAVFWWPGLKRQVRLEGRVELLEPKRAEEYFRTRERGSQIGAWASKQSHVISNREELENQAKVFEKKYLGLKVPCPPSWGGFRLIPSSIEFWQQRANRLHDRFRYRPLADRSWVMERLAP